MNCAYYVNGKGACVSPNNVATQGGTVQDKGAFSTSRCKSDKHKECPFYGTAKSSVATARPVDTIQVKCPHCNKIIKVKL